MNKTTIFFNEEINKSTRLDKYLASKLKSFTRSQIKKIILSRGVKINNKIVLSASEKIKHNCEIEIQTKEKNNNRIEPKKISLDIIYEDKDIVVINKPSGLTVHPGAGNLDNTLVNGLIYRYKKNLSDLNSNLRPGIVHRIDKDTSGLLVIAKNNFTHAGISKQFSDHTIKRKYQCLAWGVIRPLKGRIETFISRNKKNRKLMTVSDVNGKKAITNYKTIKVFTFKDIPKISLIECELETGRTHQIRVHLNYKNTSILGDNSYGKKKSQFKKINSTFLKNLSKFKGQALHAKTLKFFHPSKKVWLSFDSKLPNNFENMLNFLNNHSG